MDTARRMRRGCGIEHHVKPPCRFLDPADDVDANNDVPQTWCMRSGWVRTTSGRSTKMWWYAEKKSSPSCAAVAAIPHRAPPVGNLTPDFVRDNEFWL